MMVRGGELQQEGSGNRRRHCSCRGGGMGREWQQVGKEVWQQKELEQNGEQNF